MSEKISLDSSEEKSNLTSLGPSYPSAKHSLKTFVVICLSSLTPKIVIYLRDFPTPIKLKSA